MVIASYKVYGGDIDKSGNNHRVRLGSGHIPHTMKHQRFCLPHNPPYLFLGKLFYLFILQIGIHPVQIQTHEYFLSQFNDYSRHQIQIKIGEEIKTSYL